MYTNKQILNSLIPFLRIKHMGFQISLTVKVKVAVARRSDIYLEFVGAGSSYQEIRQGCEQFVSDYVTFHGIKGVQRAKFVYGDNDALIVDTVENLRKPL
ncbi:MAG TPA: hypothetical protein VLE21_00610 [Candidatus Nitrosocosmicus sp.]|nr:hypothetical protein [Candidatus Nitrosocosmicus sp.]